MAKHGQNFKVSPEKYRKHQTSKFGKYLKIDANLNILINTNNRDDYMAAKRELNKDIIEQREKYLDYIREKGTSEGIPPDKIPNTRNVSKISKQENNPF